MADFQTSIELKAVTGQLDRKLATVNQNLRKVDSQVQKTQSKFQSMGQKVSKSFDRINQKIKQNRAAIAGFGLAITGLVGKGVSDFKKFEDGLTQIGTLGVKDLAKVRDQLNGLRKQFGVTGAEATKGYYDVISAGAEEGEQALNRLTAATKLAKAGNTDLNGAIDIVTSGLNIFADNGENATSITDKLFLAVKYGKTTVEELGHTFGFLAPTVDAAGLGMADYAASMATVTAGGIQTKQATTGLKAVLSNIIKVTPKAEKTAKRLGIEFNSTALRTKGLAGFMQDLREKTGGNIDELGRLFDSVEAINTVAVLTSDTGLKSLNRNMEAMGDSAGTTQTALEKVKQTASFQFDMFNSSLSIMSETIGAALVPSLLDMAKTLGPIVDFFAEVIAAYPGILKITAAVTALGVSLAFLGTGATLIFGGVIGAIIGVLKYLNAFEEGGKYAFQKVILYWHNFQAGFDAQEVFNNVKQWFGKTVDYINSITWDNVFSSVIGSVKDVINWFKKLWNDVVGNSYYPDFVEGIKDWTSRLESWFVDPIKEYVDKVKGYFSSLTVESAGFDMSKTDAKMTATFSNIEKMATVIGGVIAGWFAIKNFKNITNSFKSFTDVGGKQGFMNRVIYGKEGTARNFQHQVKKSRKELLHVRDAMTLQQGGKLNQMTGESTRQFKKRVQLAKRYATIDTDILKAKNDIQTKILEKHANKVAMNTTGKGRFARLLFGEKNTDTIRGKIKGLATQTSTMFSKSYEKIKSKVPTGSRFRGGVLGTMMLGQQGAQGFSAKMTAVGASVRNTITKMKVASFTSYVKNGLMGNVVWGKGGLVAIKDRLKSFGMFFANSVKRMSMRRFAKGGIIAALIWGAAAATSEASEDLSIMEKIKNISFDSLKEKASNFISEYGEEGLMMWLMFGAPGLGAVANIGNRAWTLMKKGWVSLATRLGAILGPLGLGIMSGPIGWIALGVAAVGALTYAYWDDIKPFFEKMYDDCVNWFTSIDWSGIWDGIVEEFKKKGAEIKAWFQNLIPSLFKRNNPADANTVDTGIGAASGGYISGDGTGTSDSIPAMLSNGEFVVRAKAVKKNRKLLEAINSGGIRGFKDGGSVADAKSYQFLQFTGEGKGSFSVQKTIDKFIGNLDKTNPAVQKVVRMLESLQSGSENLTKAQILEEGYARSVNEELIKLLPEKKKEAEVTANTAGAVKDLGTAAEDLAKFWKGIGEEFTAPIKESLLKGGKGLGDALKAGVNRLFMGMSEKYLDRAFAPLEAGIENWVVSQDSGGGMFDQLSGIGDGIASLFEDFDMSGIMDSFTGLFNNFDFGSLFGGGGAEGGLLSGIGTLFGFSKGGIVPKPHYLASGGQIGPQGTDTVPAWLTPGEVVLNAGQQENLAKYMGASSYNTYNLDISGNVDQRAIEQIRNIIQNSPREVNNANNSGRRSTSGIRRR